MGFLSLLWGSIFIISIGFIRDDFVFSMASLPTFGARIVIEIMQIHVMLLATVKADRSTWGFLRIITIPILLTTDIFLDYKITPLQITGIGIIILSLIILFINHGIKKKGMWLVLFTAVNSAAAISLYKYDITHFNSVEAEQSIIILILMVYLFIMAVFVAKENPILFLKKPFFILQSIAGGLSPAFLSFAYLFAPASVITTGKRSFSILWSMLSGNMYFHEKNFLIKFSSFTLIVVGLILLFF